MANIINIAYICKLGPLGLSERVPRIPLSLL